MDPTGGDIESALAGLVAFENDVSRNGQNGPFARQMKLAITAILPLFLKTLERERVHVAAMLITWKSDSDDAM